jgi:microcystin-dependent protein
VIGTTYGAGDGSTTFNLPDLQGRVPVGYSPGGKTEVNTLGNNDGLAATLRTPSHHHTYAKPLGSGSGLGTGTSGTPTANTSGDANNTDKPAYLVINYMIKT